MFRIKPLTLARLAAFLLDQKIQDQNIGLQFAKAPAIQPSV